MHLSSHKVINFNHSWLLSLVARQGLNRKRSNGGYREVCCWSSRSIRNCANQVIIKLIYTLILHYYIYVLGPSFAYSIYWRWLSYLVRLLVLLRPTVLRKGLMFVASIWYWTNFMFTRGYWCDLGGFIIIYWNRVDFCGNMAVDVDSVNFFGTIVQLAPSSSCLVRLMSDLPGSSYCEKWSSSPVVMKL